MKCKIRWVNCIHKELNNFDDNVAVGYAVQTYRLAGFPTVRRRFPICVQHLMRMPTKPYQDDHTFSMWHFEAFEFQKQPYFYYPSWVYSDE